MVDLIPFLDLTGTTAEVTASVLRSWEGLLAENRFVGGSVVEQFEREWAEYCGTDFAIGVANGTDALHLTLRALGIGPGDEVVVPANSFVATAEGVVLAGATPRFADVDPDTLLLTAAELEASITPRTRAVLVVHLYGQTADMDALGEVARRHGIVLIEDAAQAHGATWRGRRAGSVGRAGCFSFYPGKNLGAFGDAGAVVTSDEVLAQRVRSMRDHGRADGSHYDHTLLGTNSRLDVVQAAVLSAKIPLLDGWNESRRRAVEEYRLTLSRTPVDLVDESPGARGVFHLAVIRVQRRAHFRRVFESLGVGTAVHYPIPIHMLDPYARWATRPLPVAECAAREVLSLPMFPGLRAEQIERVCAALDVIGEMIADEEPIRA